MGSLCVSEGSQTNNEIAQYQNEKFKQDKDIIRTLLLGPGATGKSTLFRSFQLANEGNIPEEDRKDMRHTIRCNIAMGICTLITKSVLLYNSDPVEFEDCKIPIDNYNNNNESLESQIRFIEQFYVELTYITDESMIDLNKLSKAAIVIDYLWKLPWIQATYSNRCKHFAFDDNLPYFFENVDSIMAEDYIPSEEHLLKNRARSTGMNKYEYLLEASGASITQRQYMVEILDVGGQRNERRKWIHYFAGVNGVIFVASLIDYNGVLFEDAKMNAFKECLNLFETTIKTKWFEHSSMILFLNKDDLLRKLLQTSNNGLGECFCHESKVGWKDNEIWNRDDENDYYDSETGFFKHDYNYSNDNFFNGSVTSDNFEIFHDKVIDFIRGMFYERNTKHPDLTCHITTALHDKAVQEVFHAVHTSILLLNLKKVGIWGNGGNGNNGQNNNENSENGRGGNGKNGKQNKSQKKSKGGASPNSNNGAASNAAVSLNKYDNAYGNSGGGDGSGNNSNNYSNNNNNKITNSKDKVTIQMERMMDDSQLRVRSTSRSVDLSHTNTATVTNTMTNTVTNANSINNNINSNNVENTATITVENDKDENRKAMFDT